jgi:DNA modification methylase
VAGISCFESGSIYIPHFIFFNIFQDNVCQKSLAYPFLVSCGMPDGNVISVKECIVTVKEKDTGTSYQRQKAVDLYTQLIQLLSKDKSMYIIDGCSGVGSCALACTTLGRKCIVLEKCPIKARMIRQRVNIN